MVKKAIKPLCISVICSTLMVAGYALANQQSSLMESDMQAEKVSETAIPKQVQIQTYAAAQEENRRVLQSWLPKQVKPIFFDRLVSLYSSNQMQPLWQDKTAVQRFEQQLLELALAGFQPQFGQWLIELNDPQLSDMGRDLILSDAMLGYLQFVSDVSHQAKTGSIARRHTKLFYLYLRSSTGGSKLSQIAMWPLMLQHGCRSILNMKICIRR